MILSDFFYKKLYKSHQSDIIKKTNGQRNMGMKEKKEMGKGIWA